MYVNYIFWWCWYFTFIILRQNCNWISWAKLELTRHANQIRLCYRKDTYMRWDMQEHTWSSRLLIKQCSGMLGMHSFCMIQPLWEYVPENHTENVQHYSYPLFSQFAAVLFFQCHILVVSTHHLKRMYMYCLLKNISKFITVRFILKRKQLTVNFFLDIW